MKKIYKTIIILSVLAGVAVILVAKKYTHRDNYPVDAAGRIEGACTVIDFGAGKCRWCKMMAKELETLRNKCKNLNVSYVDVHKDPNTTQKYDAYVIPSQIFLDPNGNLLEKHEGFITAEQIVETFEKYNYDVNELHKNQK